MSGWWMGIEDGEYGIRDTHMDNWAARIPDLESVFYHQVFIAWYRDV